jgi:riboflavin-specific deaminase-like protein
VFIFSNLATSLDGKIATKERSHFPLGTPADRKQMQVLRKRSDVIVMGASSLRPIKTFCGVKGQKKQPANAVLSSNLKGISPNWPFFKNPHHQRILFLTEELSRAREKAFGKTSTILYLKKPTLKNSLATQMIRALKELGHKNILVEGGGTLMWEFTKEKLIEEYNITLTPKILGGKDAPSLVEGIGFFPTEVLNLKLKSCRKLGDELYLVYSKKRR